MEFNFSPPLPSFFPLLLLPLPSLYPTNHHIGGSTSSSASTATPSTVVQGLPVHDRRSGLRRQRSQGCRIPQDQDSHQVSQNTQDCRLRGASPSLPRVPKVSSRILISSLSSSLSYISFPLNYLHSRYSSGTIFIH